MTFFNFTLAATSALTLSVLIGCTSEISQAPIDADRFSTPARDIEDAPQPDLVPEEVAEAVNAQVGDAELDGSFNNGVAVSGEAEVTMQQSGYLALDLLRVEDGGAALALIDIVEEWNASPLDGAFFWTAGNRAVFSYGMMVEGPESAEDLSVTTTVCVGESGQMFDVDAPADEVTVLIDEGANEDERVVTVIAAIGAGTLESSFVIER